MHSKYFVLGTFIIEQSCANVNNIITIKLDIECSRVNFKFFKKSVIISPLCSKKKKTDEIQGRAFEYYVVIHLSLNTVYNVYNITQR